MNENALPSIEQNTVVTMSATQTGYDDEEIESSTICENILDNKGDFCDDEKNSTMSDVKLSFFEKTNLFFSTALDFKNYLGENNVSNQI